MRSLPSRVRDDDHGSAVVEFVLVAVVIVVLGWLLLQTVLTVHVRNTLISIAHEGARLAARADQSPEAGVDRAEQLAGQSLGGLEIDVTSRRAMVDELPVVDVVIDSTVPVLGWWGPTTMTVVGSAYDEATVGQVESDE